MPSFIVNRAGNCPYCICSGFIPTSTQNRQPGQTLMQCATCLKWSIRNKHGTQYPLQNPIDQSSSPTTICFQ